MCHSRLERQKGVKNPRRHGLKVRGRGTYDGDKPPMIGMVSRVNGEIRLTPSKTVRSEDILKKAIKRIDDEAIIYHDYYKSYSSLD